MKPSFTNKQYLHLLHISVCAATFLLGMFIIADIRFHTLGEPFGDHLMAMSIAISRLVYDLEGFIGYEQILEVLKQIPNVSLISLDSPESYREYSVLINEVLQQATSLQNINPDMIHAYVNEQAYLYYVLLAFSLFGISIQSLSYLWILLIFLPVLVFQISFRKNVGNLLLLWSLLVAVVVIHVANLGAGKQLITVHNYRFVPVLGLVPFIHIVVLITKHTSSLADWVFGFVQIILLVFVMLIRGSSQWMLIAIVLATSLSIWGAKRRMESPGDGSYDQFTIKHIVYRTIPIVATVLILLVSKSVGPSLLHQKYNEKLWARTHVVWHPAVIGLTTDPVLWQRHVCADKPLTDILMGFRPVLCKKVPDRYPRLVYSVFNRPNDIHGFHAAVRYLRENGSNEQIGMPIQEKGYFNIDWKKYDGILRHVYFDMLKQDPIDAFYMYVVAKPLRYMKEAGLYAKYFATGLWYSPILIFGLAMLIILGLLHYGLLRGFNSTLVSRGSINQNETRLLQLQLLIICIASLVPSILFYSQAHTIPDSVAVFLTLGFFLTVTLRPARTL